MKRHDVVVIGGSLAGAACVRQLERLGIDAVALERDRFPRAKVCGGFVSPGGVRCLQELGVLEEVRAAGAVEIYAARVAVGHHNVSIPFERPGLGISRRVLDDIVARSPHVRQGHAIRSVVREGSSFHVDDTLCSAVIDASGKLSRFTQRRSVDEFGIQYFSVSDPLPPLRVGGRLRESVLEFSFFEDGYGGTVSIEGGQSNSCFLTKKDALHRYLDRPDCLVTGPLAYERVPGEFIAIGDAAGMVDPFCGEGMRHALDTGILAARVVAAGIRSNAQYPEMKRAYESAYHRRWAGRKALGAMIRRLVWQQKVFAPVLRITPAWLLNRMWS